MKALLAAAAVACLVLMPYGASARGNSDPNFGYTADGKRMSKGRKFKKRRGGARARGSQQRRNDPKTVACRKRAIAAGVKARGGKRAVHAYVVRCKRGKI